MTKQEEKQNHLKNLRINHVGSFHIPLLKRNETLDETLDKFGFEDTWGKNIQILDRTTHLYRTSEQQLDPVRERLIRNPEFVHSEIVHKSSYLGLPYQIYAKHKKGFELYFDGLVFFITKVVDDGEISIGDVSSLTGAPMREDRLILDLENSIRDLLNDIPEFSYSSYSYYSADVIDWKRFNLTNTGNAQVCLQVNDENIVTITGLTHVERGTLYDLHIGDSQIINEINSHHMMFYSEYKRYADHVDKLREGVSSASSTIFKAMVGATKPIHHLFHKYRSWNCAKHEIVNLYEIKNGLYRYELFIEAVLEVIDKRHAVKNVPNQIWIDDERDDQWQISEWFTNFLGGKLIDGEIVELKNEPNELRYVDKVKELEQKINLLKQETDSALINGKDLLSATQTELSMYAVWIAILALVATVIVTLLGSSAG